MALYKSVLHHSRNTLPKWYLEAIGVYVSLINKCAYCVEHHFAGLSRLLDNNEKSHAIFECLKVAAAKNALHCKSLSNNEIAGLSYAYKLTKSPTAINESDIVLLQNSGFDDGMILEINQVTAYFAYANRTVLGLGVTIEGDAIGLSPNNTDDEKDWGHQ